MVAGAPFFFGEGEGDGLTVGLGLGLAVVSSVGLGEDEGVSEGDGEGDVFFFFFPGEALGEDSGVGVGEDFFFFLGEGETLGSGVCGRLGTWRRLARFSGRWRGRFLRCRGRFRRRRFFGEPGFSSTCWNSCAVFLARESVSGRRFSSVCCRTIPRRGRARPRPKASRSRIERRQFF